ncbi:MAG: sodium/proline symporter [Prochlorotrichaceae cyanobacterium]
MNVHEISITLSFAAFLVLFIGVGLYSGLHQKETVEDYLLASRQANPWLTGLSTVATSNSGFMFIGLIGFTYGIGIAAIWLVIGWILGDFIAWILIHERFRRVSEGVKANTIPAFLGQDSEAQPGLTLVTALTTLAFLGVYAASQLQAGSKALNVIFGLDYRLGILLGAIVVTIYCVAGGIRASIWVGSLQALLMIFSMLLLVVVAIVSCGGTIALWEKLEDINPALLSLAPPNLKFGLIPFALSWLAAGFGVVGQPHVMRRIMSINSVANVSKARNVYTVLYILFACCAIGVGLASRVLLPGLLDSDPEVALPQLAENLLPGIWIGIILAGLFASTISTADAQLLTCSAALTQDIFPQAKESFWAVRGGTLGMALLIFLIAIFSDDNVFVLATVGWASLGAALGPIMVVRAMEWPLSRNLGLAMIVTGISIALFWRFGLGFGNSVCEALPGMIGVSLVYGAGRILFPVTPSEAVSDRSS